MKKRSLILFVLLICCTFFLAGCATVSYSVVEEDDGGVSQVLDLTLDTVSLRAAGATDNNIASIDNRIKTILESKKNQLLDSYSKKVAADDLSSSVKKSYLEWVAIETKYEGFSYQMSLKFNNVAVYYYFYDIDPDDNDNNDVEVVKDSLFYSKYIQRSHTIFSNSQLVDSYMNEANAYCKSLGINTSALKKPTYSYSYKTSNTKLHSDSDEKSWTKDGSCIHTWNMTSETASREIVFYTVQPRRAVWYAFALGGTLVMVAVLFVVNFVKTKKQKKNEVEIIEP